MVERAVRLEEHGLESPQNVLWRKAIAIDPNYATAYFHRGVAYYEKGDKEQAIADYRKALEIEPSDQDAKEGLKRLGVTP